MTKKEQIRKRFRDECFARDGYCCAICRKTPPNGKSCEEFLDAHHIEPRKTILNGGYVKENGITLCPDCHLNAEYFFVYDTALPGFSQSDLYAKIGSSFAQAVEASKKLES